MSNLHRQRKLSNKKFLKIVDIWRTSSLFWEISVQKFKCRNLFRCIIFDKLFVFKQKFSNYQICTDNKGFRIKGFWELSILKKHRYCFKKYLFKILNVEICFVALFLINFSYSNKNFQNVTFEPTTKIFELRIFEDCRYMRNIVTVLRNFRSKINVEICFVASFLINIRN